MDETRITDAITRDAVAAYLLRAGEAAGGTELLRALKRMVDDTLGTPSEPTTPTEPMVPVTLLEELANRLDGVIGQAGCGQLPEFDFDRALEGLADEAADAAYEAAKDAVRYNSQEIDTSELDEAQRTIDNALGEARDLLGDMETAIAKARAGEPVEA